MLNNILKIKNFLPDFLYNFFRNVYHIFRFYNLIRPNYGVKDDIIFGDKDTAQFLKQKILNSKKFLEFGTGKTTILASKANIDHYSIESDKSFYFYMKKKNIKNILFYSLGFVSFYSYPLFKNNIYKKFYKEKAKIYASKIFERLNKDLFFPDLILVDGRFRVLCMLNIFLFLKSNNLNNTCVILDDFKDRPYYNEINSFFKINLKGRLAICYVKDRISLENIKILIEKYSSDPR